MTLTFYNCKDDPRTLHKTLGTALHTVTTAVIYDQCSILQPNFLLDYDADILESNYIVSGSELGGRQYFINDVTLTSGGKCVVNCTVDVLGTYADEIDDMQCNIVRQANIKNAWLPDSKMQKTAETYTCNLQFDENPFEALGDQSGFGYRVHYVLAVVGGDGT